MTTIRDLKPDNKNARKRTDRSASLIQESLQRYGAARSIVIDEDGRILAGNGTVEGAKAAGISKVRIIETEGDEIVAVRRTGLTEEQKIGLALADNRTSDLSEWDALMLQQLSEEQDLAPWFDPDDLAALLGETEQVETEGLTDPDDVPEPPAEPVTKPGDIWLLGKHRVMCGDSTAITSVERLMAGGKADMVFTDPPYGMGLDTDYSTMSGNEGCGKKYETGAVDSFTPEMVNAILCLNAKEVFMWGADYYSQYIPQKNEGTWLVWDKRESGETGNNVDKRFGSMFELCWSKVKHKREIIRYMWAGMMKQSDIDKGRHHPTQKPANLAVWFIEKFSAEGDCVLDLFGGSGSTLIACEKTSRQCRMMELDPTYCDVIVKRWQAFTGMTATLEATGKPFPTDD